MPEPSANGVDVHTGTERLRRFPKLIQERFAEVTPAGNGTRGDGRGHVGRAPVAQQAIHEHHPESKYDVERLGGKWMPKWYAPRDYTVNGKPNDGAQ
jgi:hypothetical protein